MYKVQKNNFTVRLYRIHIFITYSYFQGQVHEPHAMKAYMGAEVEIHLDIEWSHSGFGRLLTPWKDPSVPTGMYVGWVVLRAILDTTAAKRIKSRLSARAQSHIPANIAFKTHFNIIFPSTQKSFPFSIPVMFSKQLSISFLLPCYMPSHSSAGRRAQICSR
jgi:hypothetical protein